MPSKPLPSPINQTGIRKSTTRYVAGERHLVEPLRWRPHPLNQSKPDADRAQSDEEHVTGNP